MTPQSAAWPLPCLLASLFTFAVAGSVAAQDDPLAYLPSGPKNLIGELTDDAAALLESTAAERTVEDWAAHLAGMDTAMTDGQLAMLADYLSLNLPTEASGTDVAAVVASLPDDGRELFAANCFSCHGVVDYYLLQDRDVDGWMDIFSAPYHRRLLTGDNERETFSSYAAHAMPIPEDAVPEALKQ